MEQKHNINKKDFQLKVNHLLANRYGGGGPQVNKFEQDGVVVTWADRTENITFLQTPYVGSKNRKMRLLQTELIRVIMIRAEKKLSLWNINVPAFGWIP